MNEFDKMMRDDLKSVPIPESYDGKIDKVLDSLPEKKINKNTGKGIKVRIVLAIAAVMIALSVGVLETKAGIFDTFKMTILDLFGIEDSNAGSESGDSNNKPDEGKTEMDELGVGSSNEKITARKDLMIELTETVIDTHGIYALVRIAAPPEISFSDDVSFDYYAFCEGENYNSDNLIGGVVDCHMFERLESHPNEALFVITLTGDVGSYEGKYITASFKDLTLDANGEDSRILVEGMWSVSFHADSTVRDSIVIDGSLNEKKDVTFSYINTSAKVVSIEMSPLGITLISDVSNMPFEELGVSDTTIKLRIEMTDGTEYLVNPYSEADNYIVDSGESEFDQEDGISYQKDIYSFSNAVDVNKVAGFYVQDIFIPAK